ncbi:MAG: alpha/beta fold hydrolase [Pseudomonadales bacterium]
MNHSEWDNHKTSQPKTGATLISRRGAMLGIAGLAASSVVTHADEPPKVVSEQVVGCDSSEAGITAYIEQLTQPLPEKMSVKEGFVKVGSANLWYRDTGGDGEAIILLHPSSMSGHCWGYQEQEFSSAGYRVISYSRRGYRGTIVNRESDVRDAVDDLLEIVVALNIQRFHAVGSAGGAAVAAGFAARWPDNARLASLVIACSLPMFEKSPDPKKGIVFPKKFLEFKGSPRHLRGLGSSYRDANAAGVARWRELHERARGEVDMLDMASMQPFGAISSLSEFEKIKAPTLYISGSADLLCTPVSMETYARRTPDAEIAIINGAGHSAFWETPKAFNKLVMNHVGRVQS